MSKNDKNQPASAPSPEILINLHKQIKSLLPLSFTILEKHKSTSFFNKHNPKSFGSSRISHVSYKGIVPVSDFENIGVIFYPLDSLEEEYRSFIGCIEIMNSLTEDKIPVLEIRAFIKDDSGIFESFDEMLTESKIFHSKIFPTYIYLEQSYCLKDSPPEALLKKKIPVREISIFQKISCVE